MIIELSQLEKKVITLQQRLIDRRKEIPAALDSPIFAEYAAELAANFFPRSKSAAYQTSATELFTIDLATAPTLHREAYLWRRNYSDLDVLTNFYKFTSTKHRYFYALAGDLPTPTEDSFKAGLEVARFQIDADRVALLFDLYNAQGARSRIAARIIETIAGLPHDARLNQQLGFNDDPSKKNLRAATGKGKFRYLRRGRSYFALGTVQTAGSIDLRRSELEIFDYIIRFTADNEVSAHVSPAAFAQLKADLIKILDAESAIYFRLRKASELYERFHHDHRFATKTNWSEVDKWLKRRFAKAMKAFPKLDWHIYQASEQRFTTAYLPRRTNFFWHPEEELHCNFRTIWTPFA